MLDPFVNGRGSTGGTAADRRSALRRTGRQACRRILRWLTLRSCQSAAASNFEQRWTAWGSGFGGSNRTNGDPVVGSTNITASTYGFAGGMDYHFPPDTVVGFALAGGGTNWGLAQRARHRAQRRDPSRRLWHDVFRPGLCRRRARLRQHWFTTNRTALGDQLSANFIGQSYGARLESGYRYRGRRSRYFGVTPYAALQMQEFHTPAYSETDLTGGGFGLSYNANERRPIRAANSALASTIRRCSMASRSCCAAASPGRTTGSAIRRSVPPSSRCRGRASPSSARRCRTNLALTTAGAQLFFTPRMVADRQVRRRVRHRLADLRRLRHAALYMVTTK